jgi:DNA-binding NarL/FixJ family response regulator
MGLSISSALATASLAAADTAPAAAAQKIQPTTTNSADTVTLTEAQQVYQLYNQGQNVSQIAFSLSLPMQAVDSYLGISAASS